jgi:hypothetical protein
MGHSEAESEWPFVTGICVVIISFFGFLGTLFSLWVLIRNKLKYKESFRKLLIGLCICDTLCLIRMVLMHFSYMGVYEISFKNKTIQWVLPIGFDIAEGGTKYYTLFISIERLIAIKCPKKLVSSRWEKGVSVFVPVIVIIFALVKYWTNNNAAFGILFYNVVPFTGIFLVNLWICKTVRINCK